MKNYLKIDFEKIPIFNNKKIKMKKNPSENFRGHVFMEMQMPVKSYCTKCNLPFWGIGFQGLICQSKQYLSEISTRKVLKPTHKIKRQNAKWKYIETVWRPAWQSIAMALSKQIWKPNTRTKSTQSKRSFQKVSFESEDQQLDLTCKPDNRRSATSDWLIPILYFKPNQQKMKI